MPEAQMDRFLYKLLVSYPYRGELASIVRRTVGTTDIQVHKVADGATLLAMNRLAVHEADGKPVLENDSTLRRLGEIAVRISYLELLCKRSISAMLHGGDAFGSASLAKSVWAEIGQDLSVLAYDVLGPVPANGRWAERRLSTRSLTVAGGTTQINKGITATRVLGLPRK